MHKLKLAAAVVGACLAVAATGVALGATSSKTTIDQSQTLAFKPNRYVKDGLRWRKDVYTVKSGGTLHLVDAVVTEGPHTFTIVKKSDRPRTAAQFSHCRICEKLGQAHGADPNSPGPPKFQFLEDGVGQNTPPDIDRPGDSVVIGMGKKGESVDVKVTAKKGTTLYFMCLIHAQMQAKLIVK
jgi:uncharacterized cupredoxin-like copper-binding protein